MIIDIRKLKILPIMMASVLTVQTSVSFNVFSFLRPLSYLTLGLGLLNFSLMMCLFSRRAQMSLLGGVISIYYFLLITFSIIGGTDVKSATYTGIGVWLILLLYNYYKDDCGVLLKTFALTLSICAYANLLLMVLFPSWMFAAEDSNRSFLLGGNYNSLGCRFLCGIVLSMLCIHYGKKWLINALVLSLVSLITLVMVGSMTSLSSIALFLLLCLIPSVRLKKIALVGFFTVYVLFQVFVVFGGEGLYNNELAVYFIRDVLGKDLTFTFRTSMWDAASRVVAESPIIGYGMVDNDWYVTNMSSFAIGPHNFLYAVLIYGGVSLLLVFLCTFAISLKHIVFVLDNSAMILLLGINTLLFMMLMEAYPDFFIMLLLITAYYYPSLRESWIKEPVNNERNISVSIDE